jgi:deoxyadenosine/deoxycytidine kinase
MKIGLCGTMSVGKTTLVKALEYEVEFIDYKFTTERSKYLRDLGIPLNTDSTVKGQSIFLAERASELLNENIITDRTIIDVMAFAKCADSISEDDAKKYKLSGGECVIVDFRKKNPDKIVNYLRKIIEK